jgi:hypothetical protein
MIRIRGEGTEVKLGKRAIDLCGKSDGGGHDPTKIRKCGIAVVEVLELLRERIKQLTRPLRMDGASRRGLNEAHIFRLVS